MLDGTKVGLFISGGIASYKMAELARQLIKNGAEVRVAMTASAREFITPLTLQTLTKNYVLVDTFDEHDPTNVQHINMADWLDIAVVAPATANLIGKMANGLGDDIVSSTLLAVNAPRLVVPAMNTKMWANPAVKRNVNHLRADGVSVMEPDTGFLAEGYTGKGRMPAVEEIVVTIRKTIAQTRLTQHLAGQRVIVTAGGTIERIDPVRYITNDSSGKMGYAIAEVATWYGAKVELITTKPNLGHPVGSQMTVVSSAEEMHEAVLDHYLDSDYVVMSAAVSDFRVATESEQKIKRDREGDSDMTISLAANPDILKGLGEKKTHQILIGFAAESDHVVDYAREKLEEKNLDWIIANDITKEDAGFNVDTNEVTMLGRDSTEIAFPNMTKLNTALRIWQTVFD